MKRKDIRNLLESIKSCNERLDRFIGKAEKFEPANSYGSSVKSYLSLPLGRIREYAGSLHQVLSRAWSCSLHASHQAHLVLEHRMVRSKKYETKEVLSGADDATRFTVFFNNPSPPKEWYLTEVQVLEQSGASKKYETTHPKLP